MFYVGQKVVCINDDRNFIHKSDIFVYNDRLIKLVGELDGLRKGEVYTVSDVYRSQIRDGYELQLEELPRPALLKNGVAIGNRCGFAAERFRPLIERKTDISVFQEILLKNTSKEKA